NGVAERRLRVGDVGFAVEIVALAVPALVGFDAQEHVKMPGGATARSRLAFAGQAQAHAVLDAGRHGHRQLFLAHDQARAAAARAGILDRRALAVTGGARRGDHEEALRVHHLAAAAAGRAGDGTRPTLGAGAAALVAAHAPLHIDLTRHTAHGLFE